MCLAETATRNTRAASDIDSSSVAAGEGIPPYRVAFDVSDQEDEAGDASSLVGDGQSRAHISVPHSNPSFTETQTTRFESQMTGPSFMFNTQDGVDVPYHPDSTWFNG